MELAPFLPPPLLPALPLAELVVVVTLAPIWLPGVSTMELCSHSVQMLA